MSKPCCDPDVTSMFSGLTDGFSRAIHFASSSRRAHSPSVGPYCRAVAPFSRKILQEMSSKSLTGKVSGVWESPSEGDHVGLAGEFEEFTDFRAFHVENVLGVKSRKVFDHVDNLPFLFSRMIPCSGLSYKWRYKVVALVLRLCMIDSLSSACFVEPAANLLWSTLSPQLLEYR